MISRFEPNKQYGVFRCIGRIYDGEKALIVFFNEELMTYEALPEHKNNKTEYVCIYGKHFTADCTELINGYRETRDDYIEEDEDET